MDLEAESDPLMRDLRKEIARKDVLAILGAGVSIAATRGARVASWEGLLHNGVERCAEIVRPKLPGDWAARVLSQVDSPDLDDRLAATGIISSKLQAMGGEYARWLHETVGSLRVKDNSVIRALQGLGVPIATTNYDGLIEEATGWSAVTWRNLAAVERVLRGDEQGVVHLHGFWQDPDTVVLDLRSYAKLLHDDCAQAFMRALRTTHTLLFVGFGAGLSDPNFHSLFAWARGVFSGKNYYRHFRLARQDQVAQTQAAHPLEDRVFVLSYGRDHSDLPDFLCRLGRTPVAGSPEKQVRPRKGPTAVEEAKKVYGKLSKEGNARLSRGDVEISPYLQDLDRDSRRGLTLIARPSPQIAEVFTSITGQLKKACPGLFVYDVSRFHFTLLSLITAVESFQAAAVPTDQYDYAIRDALRGALPFSVEFTGICATPNSIIAKGYPADSGLGAIREALRAGLRAIGLGRGVDERYPSLVAHVVLARFARSEDFSQLRCLLRVLRQTPLGRMTAHQCQLVVNDFYMSADKARVLVEFPDGPVHNVPARPSRFIGRQAECEHMTSALALSAIPLILESGFGGIGKSTLAAEVARRCVALSRGHFEFVVWVDLRQYDTSHRITLDHVLNTIATAIDPKTGIPAATEIEEKKHLVTKLLAGHRSLLVLDNYESVLASIEEDGGIARFIKDLLFEPAGGTCTRVLVTTRVTSQGLRGLRGQVRTDDMELQKLPRQDSIEFMKGLAAQGPALLSEEQYAEVWSLLYGLPKYMQVAIDQLAAIPFEEWKKMIGTVPDESELHRDRFFGDLFAISWTQVLSGDAKRLLMAMTYFVGNATFEALAAVTHLDGHRFHRALLEASSAYLERVGSNRYSMHRLTHTVCRALVRQANNAEFHRAAARRFVAYFLDFAERAQGEAEAEVMQQELRNIVAAVQLGSELAEWSLVVRFRPALSAFLRIRGYWAEEKQIMETVCTAATALVDFASLARCLVDDLAWLYLRLEDLPMAERHAQEGRKRFEDLGDRAGIAQALRHLGKAALLRGEYDATCDGRTAQGHFDEAERYYSDSLRLRESLDLEDGGQREKIADMKLDFGRLYWLRGRKYEFAARESSPADSGLLTRALQLYAAACEISREAVETFTALGSIRGIAKGLGNIGNAVKEHARYCARSGAGDEAIDLMRVARQYYEDSLKQARVIQRKDEIAHACWGLAETLEFLSSEPGLPPDGVRRILQEALAYAEESHDLYSSLAGPFDQRTTKDLVDRLRDSVDRFADGAEST
jgi:hypothetical protein